MTRLLRNLLAATVAASLLLPVPAGAEPAGGTKVTAKSKPTAKTHWRGYGFLPGYRAAARFDRLWRAQNRIYQAREHYEPRYVYYRPYSGYGQLRYGWDTPEPIAAAGTAAASVRAGPTRRSEWSGTAGSSERHTTAVPLQTDAQHFVGLALPPVLRGENLHVEVAVVAGRLDHRADALEIDHAVARHAAVEQQIAWSAPASRRRDR